MKLISTLVISTFIALSIPSFTNSSYDFSFTTPAGFQIFCDYSLGSGAGPSHANTLYLYPNATIQFNILTDSFNCHTFAWYDEGDINACITQSQFVIKNPLAYCGEGLTSCYTEVYSEVELTDSVAASLREGDIIMFVTRQNNNGVPEQMVEQRYKHSAIVYSEGSTVYAVKIDAKWAASEIIRSDLVHHPFFWAPPNTFDNYVQVLAGYDGDVVSVYRHNPNHVATHLLSYTDKTHTYCCYYCGRGVQTNNHTSNTYNTTSQMHFGTCNVCGQYFQGEHTADYYTHNSLTHSGICSFCGYSFQASHDFAYFNNRYHCSICGYSTTHPVSPNNNEVGD